MRQGCRESQRSYLGGLPPSRESGNPGGEARLRWQESAEAIVPLPLGREGPNVKEGEYFGSFEG